MSFGAIDAWWWPYLFILVAGWLATDSWRFLGVYLGGQLSDDADILVLVRCIATALVAAVIANLIVSPSGALADVPAILRVGAAAAGFVTYLLSGHRILVGILVGEALLLLGIFFAA
ncbi:hypothetical protein GCM10007908_29750 [Rhizobium albus]|nr:hypothetical protein GCM10007908_29750 [Rhizobium albus]